MKEGLVSIITPAYNASKYIKDAIESVLNQTYEKWELIVINDGSTDDTEKIVKSFKDNRIRLIKQENMGVSAARNRGLDEAKGEFITFLDADDVLPPKSLEVRIESLLLNKNIDIIHGIVSIRDKTLRQEIKIYKPFFKNNILKRILKLENNLYFTPGYMLRNKVVENIRFQVGMTHAEDILFLINIATKNYNFMHIDYKTYFYRTNNLSVMNNLEGWRQGYLDLLFYIKDIPNISYTNTIYMRYKIARMLTSWHIKNKNFRRLIDIYYIFGAK